MFKKQGTAKADTFSIRDRIRRAAPEPDVLRLIGEEAERTGTSKLTSRQIDRIIKASRSRKTK